MGQELLERVKKLQEKDFGNPELQREVINLLELLCGIILAQTAEIQALKDEINRLKGEKGIPIIKSSKKDKDKEPKKDTMENGSKKGWQKGSKLDKVTIHREQIVELDKTGLPDDIVFKGYDTKVIQNILIQPDNVLYKLEKFIRSQKEKHIQQN